MHYDPTRPTVAGLLAARSTSAFFRTEPSRGPGVEGLLVEALSSALRPGTALIRRPVIDTPFGPYGALLAIVRSGRRVAVVLRSDEAGAGTDAASLVLVYGTFDAVYEVSPATLGASAPRVAAAIAAAEEQVFTAAGRRALSLCALPKRPVPGRAAADRAAIPVHGTLPEMAVRRMRLNRPAEWTDAFERAVTASRTLARSA